MTRTDVPHNAGGIAAIQNVALCMEAAERALNRDAFLPGIVAFYGPSGFGKSLAATHTAVHHHAYFIQARSVWQKSALLENILKEMGIKPAKKVADMCDQAAEQLMLSGRLLILDEFDRLVRDGTISVIHDLYEASGGSPMMLIGEEKLERKLRPWETFHNRILKWHPAMPTSIDDARMLVNLYAPGLEIADDLLTQVLQISRGVTRRVCVNISAIRTFALNEGLSVVDREAWGARLLDSGEPPRRI